jgi:hypothetical protein
VCLTFTAGNASAQLATNQTQGFGNNRLVTFTYLQNVDRVDQPNMDLDFNGKPAAVDPNEMQTPICQVVTEPTVPEAWKTKVNPAITTQCPDPNHAVPGTCTMHPSSVDLSVLFAGPAAEHNSDRSACCPFLSKPTPRACLRQRT